jgi:geranylgeranyl pyrophosphate synthase
MTSLIRRGDFSADAFGALVALMARYGGIDYTRRRADEHVRQAKAALQIFGACPAVAPLRDIADYAWSRAS